MKIIMAGGGTGGHLFPALALAEEFKKNDKDVEIIFTGSKGRLEEKIVPEYGYELYLFDIEALKKRSGFGRIRSLFKALKAVLNATSMLRQLRPDGVIGSGSYSSGPVLLAASLMGIKTAIMEQNAMPGFTNRVLGKFVDRVYIAFEEAGKYFKVERTVVVGNPVRLDILSVIDTRESLRGKGKFNLFVFGGSQGATAINASFLDAAEYLTDIWGDLNVVHQSGDEGFQMVESAYKRKGLKVDLHKFITNMAEVYAKSDLVVCRSGATSIAELTSLGIASVLVPYPFASDDHQEINARSMENRGAAVIIKQDELTGKILADVIREFYENRDELKKVELAAKAVGKPDASKRIVTDYMKIFKRENV